MSESTEFLTSMLVNCDKSVVDAVLTQNMGSDYPYCATIDNGLLTACYDRVMELFYEMRPSPEYLLAIHDTPVWMVHSAPLDKIDSIMKEGLLIEKGTDEADWGKVIYSMLVCCPENTFGTNNIERAPIYFKTKPREKYGICVMQRDVYSTMRYCCLSHDISPDRLQLKMPEDVKLLNPVEFVPYFGLSESRVISDFPKACQSGVLARIAESIWSGEDRG